MLIGSNMGVGAPALLAWEGTAAHITPEQMQRLSLDTYEAIARQNYWTPLGGEALPAGIDLMSFDFGWNRGVTTSLDVIMQCLGISEYHAVDLKPVLVAQAIQVVPPEVILRHLAAAQIQILQEALGVQADGILGGETIDAFSSRQDLRVMAIILALSTLQVRSYKQLTNFSIYGRGWLARSARRQTAALSAAYRTIPEKVQV